MLAPLAFWRRSVSTSGRAPSVYVSSTSPVSSPTPRAAAPPTLLAVWCRRQSIKDMPSACRGIGRVVEAACPPPSAVACSCLPRAGSLVFTGKHSGARCILPSPPAGWEMQLPHNRGSFSVYASSTISLGQHRRRSLLPCAAMGADGNAYGLGCLPLLKPDRVVDAACRLPLFPCSLSTGS
ncbi:hypothetical protein CALVIDRAFT_30075 [Calocera viscosa TUFC12733]|uniref:Uncharacterized protein n=1 Tax=Calocera viscosa (strain TUFC12733) TaxID=1330018 RepID=A0A167PC41_CALVF|nr:hypothetical protein CALVIDRAFT_30075 [Calocera viscosa TUFC12733]